MHPPSPLHLLQRPSDHHPRHHSISFEHGPEHQRFSQATPSGLMLYFAGTGGVQWTNYLIRRRAPRRRAQTEGRREDRPATPVVSIRPLAEREAAVTGSESRSDRRGIARQGTSAARA